MGTNYRDMEEVARKPDEGDEVLWSLSLHSVGEGDIPARVTVMAKHTTHNIGHMRLMTVYLAHTLTACGRRTMHHTGLYGACGRKWNEQEELWEAGFVKRIEWTGAKMVV